ncbi:M48 family metallopeptidase [Candidatus Viadribacter manganicus]|nr:M48 family metallopeptidase [Candidatus Viadribacter manganicus]
MAVATLGACATSANPETGRNQFIIVDDAQLAQASLQSWAQVRQQTPQWRNATAQRRLETVGGRIVQAAGRGNQSWEFVLFDSPQKNAFVLPGGQVGFYRGLYEISERDDWIATVLGHETGHVTGRHAAERYSREVATQTVVQVAGAATNSDLAAAALGLGAQVGISLPFSREQESEADILGIRYMHNAGYDPKEAIPFWQRMETGGGSRPPEFLSTHPNPDNRIQRIRNYINEQGWGPV